MTVVVQETLRAVFYAPFYAALALGAYAAEGVEVRLVSAPRPSSAADGLFDGSVDVTWSWRAPLPPNFRPFPRRASQRRSCAIIGSVFGAATRTCRGRGMNGCVPECYRAASYARPPPTRRRSTIRLPKR
jgi:hypothetical protein